MKIGGDIENPALLYAKGALFGILGLLAAALILIEMPSWRIALLLLIAVWAFCRLYYFLFYVIERYIDPGFRFAGLGSAMQYMIKKSRTR